MPKWISLHFTSSAHSWRDPITSQLIYSRYCTCSGLDITNAIKVRFYSHTCTYTDACTHVHTWTHTHTHLQYISYFEHSSSCTSMFCCLFVNSGKFPVSWSTSCGCSLMRANQCHVIIMWQCKLTHWRPWGGASIWITYPRERERERKETQRTDEWISWK